MMRLFRRHSAFSPTPENTITRASRLGHDNPSPMKALGAIGIVTAMGTVVSLSFTLVFLNLLFSFLERLD